MIRWLSLILIALALFAPAIQARSAGAETSSDLSDELHLEYYSVRLDGVVVAADASVYRADDHNIYVSSTQLDAWGLKRPLKPAFDRDGLSYYGLKNDGTYRFAIWPNATGEICLQARTRNAPWLHSESECMHHPYPTSARLTLQPR